MVIRLSLFLLIITCSCNPAATAQLKGMVVDIRTRSPVAGVRVENIHSSISAATDSLGQFTLAAAPGHLIEFHKEGYSAEKLRVPQGNLPSFFKIHLEKTRIAAPEAPDWKRDSTRFAELYKRELAFSKFSTLDAIQHPFSALSKRNQQIWAFQKEYSWFEQEKYIDYAFNAQIVSNLTGLAGDSVAAYLKMFRPAYEQIRAMNEYERYTYISRTVNLYRQGINPRRPRIRSSN